MNLTCFYTEVEPKAEKQVFNQKDIISIESHIPSPRTPANIVEKESVKPTERLRRIFTILTDGIHKEHNQCYHVTQMVVPTAHIGSSVLFTRASDNQVFTSKNVSTKRQR